MSKNTVKKYIDSLYEKQLIWIEPTQIYRGNQKVKGNNKYTIRPIYEAIKYNLEKQFERNALIHRRAEVEEKLKKSS